MYAHLVSTSTRGYMSVLEQVSGKLRLLGILGDPISQVKSPLMINELIKKQQITEILMVPFHISKQNLNQFIPALKTLQNFSGAIITMPHKKNIMTLLDFTTDQAKAIGACNVIRRESDGRISGTMLDGEGFVASLNSRGYVVKGKSIYLAGAGGAASAIAHALAAHGASKISIYNRTADKAEMLCHALNTRYAGVSASLGTTHPEGYDIAINATSVGMEDNDELPFSIEKLTNTALICDIIIYPELTYLLQKADSLGHPTHYGRAMLKEQIELMLDYMLNQ